MVYEEKRVSAELIYSYCKVHEASLTVVVYRLVVCCSTYMRWDLNRWMRAQRARPLCHEVVRSVTFTFL